MKWTPYGVLLACLLGGCGQPHVPPAAQQAATASRALATDASPPSPIRRFLEGIDAQEVELGNDDVARELNDTWARLVLRSGRRPASLDQVLETMSPFETGEADRFARLSFVVGEGSQIPLGAGGPGQALDRNYRLLVTWERGGGEGIFLGAPAGSRSGFLEVVSWDPAKSAFNYYERRRGAEWVWRGDGRGAFDPRSRGQGCFACHTNGALVMKELNRPWTNWATEEAPISAEAVPAHIRPPDLPRVRELFDRHTFAQSLESRIRSGIRQWNEVRVRARDGAVGSVRSLFRQLIDSRNVNLVSSRTKAVSAVDATFMGVPPSFFVNTEAFRVLRVPLEPFNTSVQWRRYREAIGESGLRFALRSGEFRQPGDTYFAFLVPEPAAEDVDLLRQMLEREIVAPKLAASLLMVDFPNSVYSPRRNHLLRYLGAIPDTVAEGDRTGLSAQLAERIRAVAETQPACATGDPSGCSPEQEFLGHWNAPDDAWRARFAAEVQGYLGRVSAALQTGEGLDHIIRLSISRRRDVLANVPGAHLAESPLLFPETPLDPSLQMTRSGRVIPRPREIPDLETREP